MGPVVTPNLQHSHEIHLTFDLEGQSAQIAKVSGNALRLVKIGTAGDDFKATAYEISIDRKKLHFCVGLVALDAGSVISFFGFVNAATEYEIFENPQSGFRSPVLQLNSSAELKAQFSVGTLERMCASTYALQFGHLGTD